MMVQLRTTWIALLGLAVALQVGPLLWTVQPHGSTGSPQLNWHTGNPNTWAIPAEATGPRVAAEAEHEPRLPSLLAGLYSQADLAAHRCVADQCFPLTASATSRGSLYSLHCMLTV